MNEKCLFANELISLECRMENARQKKKQSGVVYEVFTASQLLKTKGWAKIIYEFYNHNWLGNKDFMHIPNIFQVVKNCLMYPVIIARDEKTNELLALSTIKYDENKNGKLDAYYPVKDASFFSITGILVKKNIEHKGIGRKIEEIAIRGLYEYNKKYKNTTIMGEIDCRNCHSFDALRSTVEKINADFKNNEIMDATIKGYYEIMDLSSGQLTEAPTLIVEIKLDPIKKDTKKVTKKNFFFKEQPGMTLFESLSTELKRTLEDFSPVLKNSEIDGDNLICTYLLDKPCSLEETAIIANKTAEGNNRKEIEENQVITGIKINSLRREYA